MQEHWVSDQVVYRGHAKSMSLRKSGVLPSLLPYHTLSWRHFLAYFYIENEKDDKDQVVRSKIWYSVTWGEGEPNLRFSKWHTFWMAPWVTKVIYRWGHLRAWLPGIFSSTPIRDYSFSCVISNRFFAFVPLLTPISLTCYDFQVFFPVEVRSLDPLRVNQFECVTGTRFPCWTISFFENIFEGYSLMH